MTIYHVNVISLTITVIQVNTLALTEVNAPNDSANVIKIDFHAYDGNRSALIIRYNQ